MLNFSHGGLPAQILHSRSKDQLEAELHLSRAAHHFGQLSSPGDQLPVRRVPRLSRRWLRRSEIGAIKKVENICVEFKPAAFPQANGDIFEDAEIDIGESWPDQRVASAIAVESGRRQKVSARIKV